MAQGIFPLRQGNDPLAVGIGEPFEWEVRKGAHVSSRWMSFYLARRESFHQLRSRIWQTSQGIAQ